MWDPDSGNNQNSQKCPPARAREASGPWDALAHRGTSGTPGQPQLPGDEEHVARVHFTATLRERVHEGLLLAPKNLYLLIPTVAAGSEL